MMARGTFPLVLFGLFGLKGKDLFACSLSGLLTELKRYLPTCRTNICSARRLLSFSKLMLRNSFETGGEVGFALLPHF